MHNGTNWFTTNFLISGFMGAWLGGFSYGIGACFSAGGVGEAVGLSELH